MQAAPIPTSADIPPDKRPLTDALLTHQGPRERILVESPDRLSDSDLLAIILGRGYRGCGVAELSQQLLKKYLTLSDLLRTETFALMAEKGIGRAKTAELKAITEIARRLNLERHRYHYDNHFTNVTSVKHFLTDFFANKTEEQFCLLLLNTQHRLLQVITLFTGTINAAAVYPRELIKTVLNGHAAAVIIAHNHPSGVTDPSSADIQITEKIKRALETIDAQLIDHFIIGDDRVTSFAEQGLL